MPPSKGTVRFNQPGESMPQNESRMNHPLFPASAASGSVTAAISTSVTTAGAGATTRTSSRHAGLAGRERDKPAFGGAVRTR